MGVDGSSVAGPIVPADPDVLVQMAYAAEPRMIDLTRVLAYRVHYPDGSVALFPPSDVEVVLPAL